ncbi:MAG: pyridoxamine 5'-phosphate oxidase [Ignavibacteriaceae bacterium]
MKEVKNDLLRTQLMNLRKNYSNKPLNEAEVDPDPFRQFEIWFGEVLKSEVSEPNAMFLATAGKNSVPSVRTVLLKGFDKNGFVFYTNYKSKKARDLSENPVAALLFFWKELERQIRLGGNVVKTSVEESREYFKTRPRESRLGAWASEQSSEIADRETLERKFKFYEEKYKNKDVDLPPFWGGFRLIPDYFEFWQGRENRLHDRIFYRKTPEGWNIKRLSP